MHSKSSAIFSFVNLSFIQAANVLVQLLLIPIVTRIVGLTEFGLIMLASSYAALVSIFINYGSNQSGVKNIALEKDSPKAMSRIFSSIYFIRALLYLLSFGIFLLISRWFLPQQTAHHFLFANMIILGELLNPFFFFVGMQKLLAFNITNLITKLLSVALIVLLVKGPADSVWVNFIMGFTQILGSIFLLVFLIKKYGLAYCKVPIQQLIQQLKQNGYLTGNNLSVQLQQSIFLFALSGMGNAVLLGAYSLCDKIVWSFRMLIISFFNVVYPRAAILYKENPTAWLVQKKKLGIALGIFFLVGGLLLFLCADWLVLLITRHSDELSVLFIQSICLVPLVAGLNSLNVAQLLLQNKYHSIFKIALILLSISILLSILFLQIGQPELFGFFPILTEIGSIPLYLYFIKRASNETNSSHHIG